MDIRSEVYNALADIMFRRAGKATRKDMELAIEWFETHFWDDEYVEDNTAAADAANEEDWRRAMRSMEGRRLR